MRRFFVLVALVLPAAFLAARPARAQAGLKIGYVDLQRAVQEVEEGKALGVTLKGELEQRRAQLDKKKQELEKMKTDYDKQSAVLSEDAKRKKQEDLQRAFSEAQASANEMQNDLSRKEEEGLRGIEKRMTQIISEVAERESFSFILQRAAVLHGPPALDATNEVVRRYNDKFPVGKPAHSAASKAAQPAAKK
ncbi:MAG TPA: OmpH family outer membrane protein [Myxococcales bacterium]|jgi:outer membrane protein|nr:OmpH family outer membrane protein [Myxococcales bacterium]